MTNTRGKAVQPATALTPEMLRAAAMLAIGATDQEVASELNRAVSTIKSWRARPAFAAEVNSLVGEVQRKIIRRGRSLAPLALNTLAEIMADPSAPHASRVAACRTLLDHFGKAPDNAATEPEAEPIIGEIVRDSKPIELATLETVYREMRKIEEMKASSRRHDDDDDERLFADDDGEYGDAAEVG